MASRKNVPASTVRAWFHEAQPEGIKAPGARGRLDAALVEAFHKANKNLRYEVAGEAQQRKVTVKVAAQDKRGRNITKAVTITTAEARALLGDPAGKRGRLPMAALRDAVQASL